MDVTPGPAGIRTARRLRGLGSLVGGYSLRALAFLLAIGGFLIFHLCSPVETLLRPILEAVQLRLYRSKQHQEERSHERDHPFSPSRATCSRLPLTLPLWWKTARVG